ncbi:MAG TPA: glycosyltransferase family 2 protein [bacterium]|nr:glycosyltransferase family 2 protein [bacterium]
MTRTGPFEFTHQTKTPAEYRWHRFFCVLPAFLSWSILISATVFSFTRPLTAAIFIIALDIYWLMRIFYMTIFLALAYGVLAVEKETDWIARCHELESGTKVLPGLRVRRAEALRARKFRQFFVLNNQIRELKKIFRHPAVVPPFDSIYHVVIIAASKEGREVLEPGLKALAHTQFPASRLLPVLAVEARAGESHTRIAHELKKQYQSHFFQFLVAEHPDGTPGEGRVKGANVTYAAKEAARFLEAHKIPFKNVIVSCFDADTVASPEYFMALTYHFMRHPKRERASFQPIPVYHNNIMHVPAFARVLETGSSFFQLIEATNPEKLVTFSSHSMSFNALVEIGYWPVDMISDDSAIFWKALIHYGGDYRVVPMYVTLSMDVAAADSLWKTLVMIYRQKLRWACGVENIPIVFRAFLKEKRISVWNKFRYVVKLIEMHISWSTLGFLITFIGWLPAISASREFSSSVLYYNSPRITSLIFNLASANLIVTIILALLLLPKEVGRLPLHKRLALASEWLLIPFIFTFLSSMPALDAQTRLARGKMMEFRVTEKAGRSRKSQTRKREKSK